MKEMRQLAQKGLARFAVVCVLLLGGHRLAAAQAPRLNREFKMKVGWMVTQDRGRMRLKLVRVESDSRCPVDVACVWAGNAEVVLEVAGTVWRTRQTLKLNTSAGPERPAEGKYGRYTVKLVGLTPQPRSTGKLKASEYTATLLVTKE